VLIIADNEHSLEGSANLEAHPRFDLVVQHLRNNLVKVREHLDRDLRGDSAFGDELVQGVSHGGTDAGVCKLNARH